ncbi:unnamed protein product [Phytophthora fragariaefolia]|uniref:Unnamed protein product n=1 Tax=Phytophthora fragariaefolia TaxID=1490495 RepID=A0A9W6XJE1_9STRA|nr:unnamed protein product [Phytophthora fragariaefolia]
MEARSSSKSFGRGNRPSGSRDGGGGGVTRGSAGGGRRMLGSAVDAAAEHGAGGRARAQPHHHAQHGARRRVDAVIDGHALLRTGHDHLGGGVTLVLPRGPRGDGARGWGAQPAGAAPVEAHGLRPPRLRPVLGNRAVPERGHRVRRVVRQRVRLDADERGEHGLLQLVPPHGQHGSRRVVCQLLLPVPRGV